MSNILSSTDQLTVYVQPKPFAILQPERTPSRGIGIIVDPSCWDDAIATVIATGDVVAIDFETRGTDPTDGEIVGMGLAGAEFNYYFSRAEDPEHFDWLLHSIVAADLYLIAHNVTFDGSWIFHQLGRHANWEACTYALYRQLATEGWTGQRWGLKEAMQDVLLWETTNEEGIDNWLISNGYVNQSGNPLKGEMWRVPADILGQYCLQDAEATYLLYTRFLLPALEKFPDLKRYHRRDFMHLIHILIEQKLIGIDVDRDGLIAARDEIQSELGPLEQWIRTESELAPHIHVWEYDRYLEHMGTEPSRYLKSKLSAEPAKYKKDGTLSKVWLKWDEKRRRPPVESQVWTRWNEKRLRIEAGEEPQYRFNLRSGDHLRWLFYDRLDCVPLEFTDTGLPVADTDSLRRFGPGGEAIEKFHLLHKELGFITDYIERTSLRSTVHPGFRVPGTLTGRLSGVSPNIQQVPKSRRFLQCLRARPGTVWIDADFTALEPVVCTELSGDPELMKVFGPDAPPGADIYLHTGVGLPEFRDQIVSAGYDPEHLTPEGAAAAKKECKQIRSICKVLYLSSSYGAGPKKIHKTLQMQGVPVSFEEVEQMHRQYWEYYGGIKSWERKLKQELRHHKGWVYNGIGRPIGVHSDYEKDVVNRVVQSTGHDILVRYVRILSDNLYAAGIQFTPIIMDFHDEVIIEVAETMAEAAVDIFRSSVLQLNAELGGTIPLKINPIMVSNLAEAKLE